MNKIIVTVGVCAKNSEDFIEDTIRSIINQDFPHENMEVIFLAAGDMTLEIIKKMALKMNIKVQVSDQDEEGLAKARNIILNNSVGEYILWIDDDIIIQKNYLRKQIEIIESYPAAAMVGAAYATCTEGNLVSALENIINEVGYLKFIKETTAKVAPITILGTGGALCRVKALKQVGGFDKRLRRVAEDVDITIRMRKVGWLLLRSKRKVHHNDHIRTWKKLWYKHFSFGYVSHFVYHKNSNKYPITNLIPLIAFFYGLSLLPLAYRIKDRTKASFLPFFLFFINTAFSLGYLRSHIAKQGHTK